MRVMATKKKTDSVLRGAALIKKAIESAQAEGVIDGPEPVPPGALKKLRLPNDEKLSPAMKELLAFDATWIGWDIDEEEPELEPVAIDELVEQEFGEELLAQFGEAIELLSEDCILVGEGTEAKSFVYVGTPDDKGEYPVLTLSTNDGCWVGGFVPFDVWVAQQLGALDKGTGLGYVPQEYESCCKALAEANGDGRVSFKSETRDVERDGEEGEDDEDDIDVDIEDDE